MARYRHALPQLSGRVFLTDGGMETTFIFLEGIELPHFASFDLLKNPEGEEHTRQYYARYAALARDNGFGFVLESPTWRANRDWGARLGYGPEQLANVNRRAIRLMEEVREAFETEQSPMVISGNIGPRGDGYNPGGLMSEREAEEYHAEQIAVFQNTEADMVSAFTLNYAAEAIGVARAAVAAEMPVVISFTVETNGRLPTGETLGDVIRQVDAATGGAPAYYMINCAHPTHFADSLATREPWLERIRGIRANASVRSHAELDAASDLDAGDPVDLGQRYRDLRLTFRNFSILGGCCGTDFRHVQQIALACRAA